MAKTSKYTARTPDRHGFIDYSNEEHQTWQALMDAQRAAVSRYASGWFSRGLELLELPDDYIPQCKDVSARLLALTDWRVEPVPALIPFRQFYGMLAERIFPAASFIRSREEIQYLQEPDIFHEIYGHTPLLTISQVADFAQSVGRLGLACAPENHVWLARLFWFTVEFGLIREAGEIRAFGAGLASSSSELRYSVESDLPERKPFNLQELLRTPYRIDIQQPVYFVMDGIELFTQLADSDLLGMINQARQLGLHPPVYAIENSSGAAA